MAKISTRQVRFEGGTFDRVIHCDSAGEFSCKLPGMAAARLGFGEVCDGSLKGCEKKFSEALEKYSALQTTTRKVIIYKVAAKAEIYDGDGEFVLRLDEIFFCEGVAVSVVCGVFIETCIRGEKTSYTYEGAEADLPASITGGSHCLGTGFYSKPHNMLLEWTPEREQFFCKLGRAIESIVLELEKLKTPETVAQIVSSGVFALTERTEGK